MEYLILACYLSIAVSFYFYNAAVLKSCILTNLAKPTGRVRKDIAVIAKESSLELKLSIVWPAILCLRIIKKLKN